MKRKKETLQKKGISSHSPILTFVDGQSGIVRYGGVDGLQTLLDEVEQLTSVLVVHLTQRPLLVAQHTLVQRLPAARQPVR